MRVLLTGVFAAAVALDETDNDEHDKQEGDGAHHADEPAGPGDAHHALLWNGRPHGVVSRRRHRRQVQVYVTVVNRRRDVL